MRIILEKKQRRRRIACYAFIAAIAVLYITNFVLRAFVYHDGILKLLEDFIFPLCVVSSIYAVDWKKDHSTNLIYKHIPKMKILAVCAPVVATFLSFLTCPSGKDSIDFCIIVFAMTSMYIAPYALRGSIQKTCITIVAQAVWFFVLAANLNNNTAAMVTIAATAVVLLLCLPKLTWFISREAHIRGKVTVAVIILVVALLCTLMIEQTGTLEAFYISSMGRPGLGSSAFVNRKCLEVFANAKLVGSIAMDYYPDAIFSNRVLTYILANAGWAAMTPILLAMILLISSGIYLCRRSTAIQYYISVSFLTVMTVQTVGYALMCLLGWDELLFSEFCPFLDSGCYANILFLLMAVCILPPKQVTFKDLLDSLDLK